MHHPMFFTKTSYVKTTFYSLKKIEKVFLPSTQTAQERQSKRSVSPGSEPRRVEASDFGFQQ